MAKKLKGKYFSEYYFNLKLISFFYYSFIPWIVSIQDISQSILITKRKPLCTGFLINENYVATSANCISNKNPQDLLIVLGSKNTSETASTGLSTINRVAQIIKHPDFNPYQLYKGYDIALLRLSNQQILEANKIEVACFDFKEINIKDSLFVAGFGVVDENSEKPSEILRYAHFKNPMKFEAALVEAKAVNANQTICTFDMGSPLMTLKNGYTKVAGISSYTQSSFDENTGEVKQCTDTAYFTELNSVFSFIKLNVGSEIC